MVHLACSLENCSGLRYVVLHDVWGGKEGGIGPCEDSMDVSEVLAGSTSSLRDWKVCWLVGS